MSEENVRKNMSSVAVPCVEAGGDEEPSKDLPCSSSPGDDRRHPWSRDDGAKGSSDDDEARYRPLQTVTGDDEARYRPFMSTVSRLRKPVMIRKQQEPLGASSSGPPVDLCPGHPSQSPFPFVSASFRLREGGKLDLGADQMEAGLQYIAGKGHPALLQHLHRTVREDHDPPDMAARDILMTSGAQEGIALALQMLLDPGDGLVIPEFCYSTALSAMCPLQPRLIPVPCDGSGLIVSKLSQALQDAAHHCRIKALYLTPVGDNPTGVTIPTRRRREIYKVVCQHDLLILEDDAYYHLQLDDTEDPLESFLSMDTERRVIRFDSFSKTIGPGLRLGWMVAPKPLSARLYYHIQSTVIHPSAFSQVLVVELLRSWGTAGLQRHLSLVREDYRRRRDVMVAAAEKHLKGLAEWNIPTGGMFLWLKLLRVRDASPLAQGAAPRAGLLVVPGNAFTSDPSLPCPFIRCSYSSTDPQQFERGFQILADVIRSAEHEGPPPRHE